MDYELSDAHELIRDAACRMAREKNESTDEPILVRVGLNTGSRFSTEGFGRLPMIFRHAGVDVTVPRLCRAPACEGDAADVLQQFPRSPTG